MDLIMPQDMWEGMCQRGMCRARRALKQAETRVSQLDSEAAQLRRDRDTAQAVAAKGAQNWTPLLAPELVDWRGSLGSPISSTAACASAQLRCFPCLETAEAPQLTYCICFHRLVCSALPAGPRAGSRDSELGRETANKLADAEARVAQAEQARTAAAAFAEQQTAELQR